MKKFFFVILLLLGVSEGFSQVTVMGTSVVNKAKKSDKVDKVVNVEFETRQQMYDKLALEGKPLLTMNDKRFIQKGDTVRYKFLFNSRMFDRIEVEGAINQCTPRDMIKGEYIALLIPEKTKVIKARMYIKEEFGGNYLPENRTVLVLEKEEFEKLDAELKEYEAKKDAEGVAKINAKVVELLKAAGVDPEKAKTQLVK